MSCLGLEFSLQFISFTNIEHFSSFGNLERLYSLLMIKWHLNFMLFTGNLFYLCMNGRFTQHITQLPQCHFLCCTCNAKQSPASKITFCTLIFICLKMDFASFSGKSIPIILSIRYTIPTWDLVCDTIWDDLGSLF